MSAARQICNGLKKYYKSLNHPYKNTFHNFCVEEEFIDLNDEQLLLDELECQDAKESRLVEFYKNDYEENIFPFNGIYQNEDEDVKQHRILSLIKQCYINPNIQFSNGDITIKHIMDETEEISPLSSQNYYEFMHELQSQSQSPINYSPVSTTSTVDNLIPLYMEILEAQTSLLPDLSLAPLDLVVSPTPIEEHSNILEIVNETPTHCNRNNNKKKQQQEQNNNRVNFYLIEENRNYDPSCDSDYDFESDLNSKETSYQLLTDQELENKLIKMGCCCSDPSERMHKANTSSNDITVPIEVSNGKNNLKNGKEKPSHISTDTSKGGVIKSKDIGKGGRIQIEITSEPPQKKHEVRKKSFADKYFRSNAQVEKNNKKRKNGKNSPQNGKSSPNNNNNNNNNDGSVEEEEYPPEPKDASNHPQNGNNDPRISLLDPNTERSDVTDTRTYGEGKDVVSPIPTLDGRVHSITERNTKRPSTSALSSPLHSVRLSITPKGHLAPIYIHDPSSMSDEEDNSISTTESKEDPENTKYSINTPVEFLKKHQTITKFVSAQQSQTSDKNVLSRRKRRPGVSERHTLTFSKPPIPAHELPQSPKFTEISLDVMKPSDFLQNILKGNLLFSGVDAEFAQKMVNKVVDLMKAADFDIDEVLMHQGAEGDAFYAVESGNFDILVTNDQGDEKKVAVAKRGDCVGEYALLYNQPRTATLRATEKSRVWGITAEQFAQMRQEIMDWNVERFERRQEFIHSIPLFQQLEQHELLNMTHACHAEIYDINDYIIKPGVDAKKNTNVYIIMEGTIVISYDRINSNNDDDEDEEAEEERKFNLTLVDIEQEQSQEPIEHGITEFIQTDKEDNDNDNDNDQNIHIITDTDNDNNDQNNNKFTLNLNMSLGSQRSATPEIITIQQQVSSDIEKQSSKDVSHGKQVFSHPINNTSDPPISDPPILEDIDTQPIQLGLNSMLFASASNLTDAGGRDSGVVSGGRESGTATTVTRNNQSNRPPFPGGIGLALSNVNSVQSVHSVNIVGNNNGPEINMNICRGDKELGPRDYFARNLFYNQYDDDDEEIVCARAHTQCKVLKIARDDFVLIMQAAQQNNNGQFIYGAIGDGILPDNKIWANQKPEIKFDDLIEQDVLGIGSFGKVTLVKHKKTGETYALKAVSKYRVVKTGQEEHIINEKRVLTMLDSPFCVKLYATFKTDTSIYFLTEVVLGGELFTVLRYNVKFDHKATRFYAGCVIMALEHLHSMDIIYRDLKPENLLLNSKGYLQLTDFGFAKKRNTTCTLCGTPQYLAPEVIHNWVQSFATDWWALGVLLFEMVVGHAPFEDDENIKMYEKILVHEPDFPQEMKINSKLRHLITKLLEKNAYQRLGSGIGGSRQVKQHPFFKTKLDWDLLLEQKIDPPYVPNIDDKFDTSNFDHFSDYEESSDEEDLENIDLNSHHFQWAENF